LAGAATILISSAELLAIPLLVLATGVIGAGVVGLVLQYLREKQRAAEEVELPPRLNIHRHTDCSVDRTLVEKLVKAIQLIKQRAQERHWDVAWPAFEEYQALGAKRQTAAEWPEAFREYCRALRVLAEALRRHRHKEEVFQPLWDKE